MVSNKNKFNKKYGYKLDEGHSKAEISKLTGVSVSILDKVYYRGVGARKSNPQSVRSSSSGKKIGGNSLRGKMSGPQWGYARIYSFVMKQPGTWGKADKDLADKVRASRKKK
tara:strand:- start:2073 stop:2408 length:336 start_codon:yes stop_codon:yes gene_type:complete